MAKSDQLLTEIQRELTVLQQTLKRELNTRPENAVELCIQARRKIKELSVRIEPTNK